MSETMTVILSLVAGFGLGFVCFGGLWLTVRALPRSRKPTVLMLGSYWARTALVLTGFALVGAGHWQNLVFCLIGFTLARFMLARRSHGRKRTRRTAE